MSLFDYSVRQQSYLINSDSYYIVNWFVCSLTHSPTHLLISSFFPVILHLLSASLYPLFLLLFLISYLPTFIHLFLSISSCLIISIVDGRYNEQKNRLQECGLKTCMYIVEGLTLTGTPRTVLYRNVLICTVLHFMYFPSLSCFHESSRPILFN